MATERIPGWIVGMCKDCERPIELSANSLLETPGPDYTCPCGKCYNLGKLKVALMETAEDLREIPRDKDEGEAALDMWKRAPKEDPTSLGVLSLLDYLLKVNADTEASCGLWYMLWRPTAADAEG